MLTIRFSRIGKKRKPFYRIIISEKQKDTKGKYLELLGHYNPHTKETVLKVDRIKHWIGVGAGMSDSIFNLLVNHKVVESDTKRRSVFISKKRREKKKDKDTDEQKDIKKDEKPVDSDSKKQKADEVPEQKPEQKEAPDASEKVADEK
jgi:small subunit ribosomal protein S16